MLPTLPLIQRKKMVKHNTKIKDSDESKVYTLFQQNKTDMCPVKLKREMVKLKREMVKERLVFNRPRFLI